MTIGRPIPPLHLSEDERETLERWSRRRKTAQALALRARLILASAEGKKNGDVAAVVVDGKKKNSSCLVSTNLHYSPLDIVKHYAERSKIDPPNSSQGSTTVHSGHIIP